MLSFVLDNLRAHFPQCNLAVVGVVAQLTHGKGCHNAHLVVARYIKNNAFQFPFNIKEISGIIMPWSTTNKKREQSEKKKRNDDANSVPLSFPLSRYPSHSD